jgi:hypothetical protein
VLPIFIWQDTAQRESVTYSFQMGCTGKSSGYWYRCSARPESYLFLGLGPVASGGSTTATPYLSLRNVLPYVSLNAESRKTCGIVHFTNP